MKVKEVYVKITPRKITNYKIIQVYLNEQSEIFGAKENNLKDISMKILV